MDESGVGTFLGIISLHPQIKNYDLIDFTLTYTKCGI